MRIPLRLLSVPLVIGAAAYLIAARPRIMRWGATDPEVEGTMPGDGLVAGPHLQTTRAVTVHAPPERVFPWVAQMGQGRAGFYSYDWLENAPGLELGIRSADRIVPRLQDLKRGDAIPIAPGPPFYGYIVDEVVPPERLVLRTRMHPFEGRYLDANDLTDGPLIDSTWAFSLVRLGPEATRLLARNRAAIRVPPGLGLPYRLVLEAVYFVMERKMLLGIRDRAERRAVTDPGHPAPTPS